MGNSGKCFSEEDINNLCQVCNLLYPDCEINLEFFYYGNGRILINGEEYITSQCRSKCSSAIVVHWPGVLGIDELGEAPIRVGIVTSIIRHPVVIKKHAAVIKNIMY